MSRAVIERALVVYLVAMLSTSLAGQSSQKKPAPKKSPADVAVSRTPPAKESTRASADIKVRTRYVSGAQLSENTTYIKGARQRVEFPGAVSIEQGDLGRTLLINPGTKTYFVTQHAATQPDTLRGPAAEAVSDQAEATQNNKAPKGGVVTYTTTLTDTGERKQMFGHDARRVTTVIQREASGSACDKSAMTVEVDGWYIDLPVVAKRAVTSTQPQPVSQKTDACIESCAAEASKRSPARQEWQPPTQRQQRRVEQAESRGHVAVPRAPRCGRLRGPFRPRIAVAGERVGSVARCLPAADSPDEQSRPDEVVK